MSSLGVDNSSPTLLDVCNLSVKFGGLRAVNNVSFTLARGQISAIIGPNGAGKTTLINLLSGELTPDSGEVCHKGDVITGLPAHSIAARGIGRSYQIINIFPEFSCFRNCWLAARGRYGSGMEFFCPANHDEKSNIAAAESLEIVGLLDKAYLPASHLSYGEQRQLEISMLLALKPEVLLLDEPLAGLGMRESSDVLRLIKNLARDHAILLIEHDVEAVFAIANELTVMVNGEVLETGPPDRIKESGAVRHAYLGNGI
ncbi:MAG: hypothetical protein CBB68_14330 [Rhodospirillaceae bacterium TMED8]|nr:ABC transporter ATP-binding protein [Magnetovibrio sp.]OUT48132.1 MAG: hypothetical protein CBB68_14330 [Rhodospirillaceae bacterium TMED8]